MDSLSNAGQRGRKGEIAGKSGSLWIFLKQIGALCHEAQTAIDRDEHPYFNVSH
jgi:hypothetical protein